FLYASPTDIYTLSLHDALPIFVVAAAVVGVEDVRRHEPLVAVHGTADARHLAAMAEGVGGEPVLDEHLAAADLGAGQVLPLVRIDRKSTRLNSSHVKISYAVFC